MEITPMDIEEFRTSLTGRARSLRYLWDWPPQVEVEDVVSTTIIKAWSSIADYQGETKGQLASWLFVILNREVIDTLREAGAEKRGGGKVRSFEDFINDSMTQFEKFIDAGLTTVSSSLHKQHLISATYAAIELLPKRQRIALLARYIGQWSMDQIAEEINRYEPVDKKVTTKAISSLLERALKKLRGLLEHLEK